MENENENEEENFQDQLIEKIKIYYESNPPITSKDEIENFLSAIDLLDVWNSDEEKETVWQCISKYMKDSKIDCEGTIQGIKDLLNQEEDQEDPDPDKESPQKETLLTRLSRLSRLSTKGNAQGPTNKLALNKYKERAIEEFDCLDSNSLIQFKKIFTLLKLNKSNWKIKYEELNEICSKHKFIKIDINDIWKYLSFCVYEENIKNLENKKEYNINIDILKEVQDFINQKIINEDLEYDSDNQDEDDSVSSSEKKAYKEEDELTLIGKIIKQSINSNENNMVLSDIKNEIRKLNYSMIDCGYRILNKNEMSMDSMEKNKELLNEQIYQMEEFINQTKRENENNIYKMELLKENIIKTNENIKIMKEDYKNLLEKYNNNQELDIDEETERLLDENMMLTQEKQNKEQEIQNLLDEKKNMRKEYETLLMNYEESIREKNELTQEMSELKINNYKLKNDYDKLISDIMNKVESEKETKSKKKDKKDDKSEERKSLSYEDQIKELKILNNSGIGDSEKISRKKNILKDMNNEKLIKYILEIDKINQSLSNERNSKEKKIYELSQKNVDLDSQIKKMHQKNIDLEEENKNMQKKIESLTNDVKNNEIFRPSIAMNSQMRISRLSKLNTVGVNQQKFTASKGVEFSTKKNVGTFKLKDKNINKQIGSKGQNTKFENIAMDLYGIKEVDIEEEDKDNHKKEKKIEFELSNQKDFVISNKEGKNNIIDISNSNDINIKGNDKINNNEIRINNDQINLSGQNNNKNQNIINNNNTITLSNDNQINLDDKKEFELKTDSNQFDIAGNNNNFFNSKESGIVFNINSNINTSNNDPNSVIEIENINDINLTSGDTNFFGEKDSNQNIDSNNKNNNNTNFFETQNNDNIFFNKEEKDSKSNEYNIEKANNSLFESKPKPKDNKISSIIPEKKEIEKNEENLEEIVSVKLDNLMGNLLDNETLVSNANISSKFNKNANISSKINENANNIIKLTKKEENEQINKNINEIQKENDIIINNNRNMGSVVKKDDLERDRTNTVVYKNDIRSSGNLEKIMLTGIQKEGFNIENTSRKESLIKNNPNNINILGENRINENEKDKINPNNKDYKIQNSNERQIIMAPSNKMFQNTINTNTNSISISSDNNYNNNRMDNQSLTEKEISSQFRLDGSIPNKIELFPSHKNSVYSQNLSQSSYHLSAQGKSPLQRTKTELEEMRNNNNDYYSLFQEEYIQKKLKEEKDKCTEFEIYSDQIFLFDDKKHLTKRFIMLTPHNLYIIEPKEMRFSQVIKKEKILSFQISNKNINIILFEIKGGNILIETLRRMDLLLYLKEHYRNDKNLIKFKYEDNFKVKIKGREQIISVKDKILSNLSNFDGAQKIGYLLKLKYEGKLIIKNIFKEKLFILTSIGLIMFDEPSSPPKKLYPIIGSIIEKIEGTKYGRENCFRIKFLSGKKKVFATRKRRELDSWLKEFDRIIKEFQTKMKQLDTMNKKFIENSDKSLLPS